MPVVICESHGQNFAEVLCHHAAKAVWAHQRFDKVTFVDLDGFMLRGWLCDDCLARDEIRPFRKNPGSIDETYSESETERVLGLIDLQPVCPKCFESLVTKREE
jgi:hypothetical protein